MHHKVRLEVLLRRRSEHFERLAQAVGLLAHLVRVKAGAQDDQGDLEQDLDALAQEAVPHPEQGVPGQGSGHRAQEPIGHVEQRVHFVLLEVPVHRGGGFLK